MRRYLLLIVFLFSFTILLSCDKIGEVVEPTNSITIINTLNNDESVVKFKGTSYDINDLESEVVENYTLIGYSFDREGKDLVEKDKLYPYTNNLCLYALYKETILLENPFAIDEIGEVRLTVNDKITSKEDYVNGKIKINSKEYKLDDTDIKIRLRGNSSLNAPKKSYKIKFDSKEDIFGFGKDKEWALIANYYDPSLMRNYYAYKMAKALGMEYAVECKYVDVYLNDKPIGLYLLCETVKTGSSRVDIESDYDATQTEIPFLLELDYKMISDGDPQSNGVENVDFFYVDNRSRNNKKYPIGTKYPKDLTTKSITDEQYKYIKNYMRDVYKNVSTDYYTRYIDVESAALYYVVEELFMNIDIDHSSVFMYKTVDSKLKFGPVWDFDISTGNCNYAGVYNPYRFMRDVNGGNYLLESMIKKAEFRELVANILEEMEIKILPKLESSFEYNLNKISLSARNDDIVWNTLNSSYWPKPASLVGISYNEQVEYLKNYLIEHFNYMKTYIK